MCSKNVTKDNASYLFFEDRFGSESFGMHAEKDMNISVENYKRVTSDTLFTGITMEGRYTYMDYVENRILNAK
ncbi:hypothetical protein FJU30_03620 [Affinibrenneria salicis]|uniref:Gp5/Type VI secretion system Vgr C-terminal trimerisation domain-containing protein n=1 Tax=Affinibrenneria salicis TaxID=2590031 RepID=A0A5J5G6N8_9GAMM|nr:hypothetical protein [Affinibrenneria salicis]KAA9002633.1 hypothetical protein FJU30_01145 [Affinibrenneria salicis]KAA9003079.1 hypothetical protein FJU30_03620 [Affinibrenneria salicis]